MSDSLREQLRRHQITFGPDLQQVQAQKPWKTGDKNNGRKPSANTSHQQEDKSMNQVTGTSSSGRDVAGNNEHIQGLPTLDERRAFADYNEGMRKAVEDLRNPLSLTNLARTAMFAGATVAFGYAVSGVVGLFKGPDVVPTGKSAVGK